MHVHDYASVFVFRAHGLRLCGHPPFFLFWVSGPSEGGAHPDTDVSGWVKVYGAKCCIIFGVFVGFQKLLCCFQKHQVMAT